MQLEAYRLDLLLPVEVQEVTPQDFTPKRQAPAVRPSRLDQLYPQSQNNPSYSLPLSCYIFVALMRKETKRPSWYPNSYYCALFGVYRWECVVFVCLCLTLFR